MKIHKPRMARTERRGAALEPKVDKTWRTNEAVTRTGLRGVSLLTGVHTTNSNRGGWRGQEGKTAFAAHILQTGIGTVGLPVETPLGGMIRVSALVYVPVYTRKQGHSRDPVSTKVLTVKWVSPRMVSKNMWQECVR